MNIVRVVFASFLIFSVALDVFAMKKEEQYGDPFTKYVLRGKVEVIFPEIDKCERGSGVLYRLGIEKVLRGASKLESVLILAPNSGDFIKESDSQIVFLMDIDSSIPKSIENCYQKSAFEGGMSIGHVDYVSSEGVFKVIENSSGEDLVYSSIRLDEPRVTLSDRLFDGLSYSFTSRARKEDSKCVETIGFLDDLMTLVTENFVQVSIKPGDTVSEAVIIEKNK